MTQTAKIKLQFNGEFFVAHSDYESRNIPKDAGFRFNFTMKAWTTHNYSIASRLREYADSVTKNEIDSVLIRFSPWTGELVYPAECIPTYYQIPAAKFALSRNRSYLAMDPGLGKTVVASLTMRTLVETYPDMKFVYMCPPFLVRNVEQELNTWGFLGDVEHFNEPRLFGRVLILPDSLLHRTELFDELRSFIGSDEAVLIVDEAHRFKNDESERTRLLLGHKDKKGIVDMFNRIIYMSGTPMPNRPLELYPILSKSAPETIDFMNKERYGFEYCAGHYDGYGYDFSGASRIEVLAKKIQSTFMYRLRKDALELPPLTEEIFVVADNLDPELIAFEQQILRDYKTEDLMKNVIARDYRYHDMPLMTYQRLLGLQKVKPAFDIIEDILNNTEENLIVFARHKEVIERLKEKLAGYKPLVITGDVPSDKRYAIVQEFQTNSERRIMLGNLKAMGIGFNITKATRVINVEPDWCPSNNDQGRDRAHRYGQTKPVYLQYLVYKNSIDHRVMNVVMKKRKLGTYI